MCYTEHGKLRELLPLPRKQRVLRRDQAGGGRRGRRRRRRRRRAEEERARRMEMHALHHRCARFAATNLSYLSIYLSMPRTPSQLYILILPSFKIFTS